jgi:hypothetical protein
VLRRHLSRLPEARAPVPVSRMGAGQPADFVIALIHRACSVSL